MTITFDSPDTGLDLGDVARLRRMKRTAAGFLAVAAALYVLTFFVSGGGAGAWGFLRAGAEAAMVGGLADWFAVTALFRRPLRLPIPHTAIIPQKKDEIATKLGTFVTANFLTPELLARHLEEAHLVSKIGIRLRDPAYTDRLGAEVSHAVSVGLEEIDPATVVRLGFELARRDLSRRSYAPLLGQLLSHVVEGDAQRPWIELARSRIADYVRDNRITLARQLKEYLEDRNFFFWLVISERRSERLVDAALRELDAIGRDPRHPLRRWLDDLLRSTAENLQANGVIAERVDLMARQMLDDERYQEPLQRFVAEAVGSFRGLLDDEGGAFAGYVSTFIQDIGRRIENDPDFEALLEGWLLRIVTHAVRDYGDELTVLIQRTVAGWNPTSAARKIEVAVGRDLQFIRINGTVVGALAGLAIHLITLALPS